MARSLLELTETHLTFLILSAFLIVYALFSTFIRNRLHLSEPPLAVVTGIVAGPQGFNALNPRKWGFLDDVTQEFTRVIAGLQVFAVGLELPKGYFPRHWKSVAWFLGPIMAFGWIVCAFLVWLIFRTDFATALTISACLTPTDPVLAASVLSNSRFSGRVPARIRHLLSAESGANDGVSFPFLYAGIYALTRHHAAAALKDWFLLTVLYQCLLGTIVGAVLGLAAHKMVRVSYDRKLIGPSAFVVFYLLLALLSVGIGSTLGLDDFLVAFAAGAAFSHDGWFAKLTRESKLNNVLDLLLNSTFFVYFGTVIPWQHYSSPSATPQVTPGKLTGLLVLILLLRRLPAVLLAKPLVGDLKTWPEAFFAGHFGPMGVGALFLAIEARARLETGTSIPLPSPDPHGPHHEAVELIWPLVTFVVFGSTMVHGLSVAAISVFAHLSRKPKDRAAAIGGEEDPFDGMVHDGDGDGDGDDQSGSSDYEEDDDDDETARARLAHASITLPA